MQALNKQNVRHAVQKLTELVWSRIPSSQVLINKEKHLRCKSLHTVLARDVQNIFVSSKPE